MKKITTPDQLNLSKEIIASLSEEQLYEVEGGAAAGEQYSCFFTSCNTPSQDESVAQEGK